MATRRKTAAKKRKPAPKKRKPVPKKRAPKKKNGVSANHSAFWSIVDAHREGPDYEIEALEKDLASRSEDEILAFGQRLGQLLDESYRGDLWGAAYLANGGCSDDGFDYFRGWLISRGKKVYEAALEDPDSLVKEVGDGDVELEEMWSVAADAWKRKTGKDDYYERAPKDEGVSGDVEAPEIDLSWAEDGEGVAERLAKAYPKLWKKFGGE